MMGFVVVKKKKKKNWVGPIPALGPFAPDLQLGFTRNEGPIALDLQLGFVHFQSSTASKTSRTRMPPRRNEELKNIRKESKENKLRNREREPNLKWR
jgi:hypothetical protein